MEEAKKSKNDYRDRDRDRRRDRDRDQHSRSLEVARAEMKAPGVKVEKAVY